MKATTSIKKNRTSIALALTKVFAGAFLIAIVIFVIAWFPVVDRLIIRPCHYYPHAFADCIEK